MAVVRSGTLTSSLVVIVIPVLVAVLVICLITLFIVCVCRRRRRRHRDARAYAMNGVVTAGAIGDTSQSQPDYFSAREDESGAMDDAVSANEYGRVSRLLPPGDNETRTCLFV
jgi:hypothetical protein